MGESHTEIIDYPGYYMAVDGQGDILYPVELAEAEKV